MADFPAQTDIDGKSCHRHDGRCAEQNDEQDLETGDSEKLTMVQHGENRRYEKQQHVGQKPVRPALHAGNAEGARRQERKDDRKPDEAAGKRQVAQPHQHLAGQPEGTDESELQPPAMADGPTETGGKRASVHESNLSGIAA